MFRTVTHSIGMAYCRHTV